MAIRNFPIIRDQAFEVGETYIAKNNTSFAIKVTRRTKCFIWTERYIDGVHNPYFKGDAKCKIRVIGGREYIDGGLFEYYPDKVPHELLSVA